MKPDDILDSIDAALRDTTVSPDAMRHQPNPPKQHLTGRMVFLADVADPDAPTAAELAAGTPIDGVVDGYGTGEILGFLPGDRAPDHVPAFACPRDHRRTRGRRRG